MGNLYQFTLCKFIQSKLAMSASARPLLPGVGWGLVGVKGLSAGSGCAFEQPYLPYRWQVRETVRWATQETTASPQVQLG